MGRKRKTRQNDFTQRYSAGSYDEDNVDTIERLDNKGKNLTRRKIADTAELRLVGETADIDLLPVGRVRQVFSLYLEVLIGRDALGVPITLPATLPADSPAAPLITPPDAQPPDAQSPDAQPPRTVLCTVRRTMTRRADASPVVGDIVRLRLQQRRHEGGPEEGVIERVEPRATLLTRADSFKAITQHPIVANSSQMMIVVSVAEPVPKWGLVDRMLVAARAGGLVPIICLNKIDLGDTQPDLLHDARQVMAHYRTLGYRAEETCATRPGTDEMLRNLLRGQSTVLAGHSGVGKSSLIRTVAPGLDIRIGEISHVHLKGKHTTTSARVYALPDLHAEIIDTPGVKLFGLWNLTEESLAEHFPDVAAGTAPEWRIESHARIAESMGARQD